MMDFAELARAPAELGALASMFWTWAVEFLPRLGAAIVIVAAGYFVAKWTATFASRIITSTERIDRTFAPAIAAVIRYAILIFVFVAALGQLGIQTTSVIAAIGAAGIAIGLALQGTLSNIAAGLMLLWLRPFRIGERIETDNIGGTVREIGLFVTLLDTPDGLLRFVPNSALWNRPLLNYSRNRQQRLDLRFPMGPRADIDKARAVMLAALPGDDRIKPRPSPEVVVDDVTDAGFTLSLRVWVSPADAGAARAAILERIKVALDQAGLPLRGA